VVPASWKRGEVLKMITFLVLGKGEGGGKEKRSTRPKQKKKGHPRPYHPKESLTSENGKPRQRNKERLTQALEGKRGKYDWKFPVAQGREKREEKEGKCLPRKSWIFPS